MEWQLLITDLFVRTSQELERVVDGESVEDLNRRPAPDCNSIGWLAWHLTSSHDRNISELAGQEQLWIKGKWYARFGRAPDPTETGVRHTAAEVEAFSSADAQVILECHIRPC